MCETERRGKHPPPDLREGKVLPVAPPAKPLMDQQDPCRVLGADAGCSAEQEGFHHAPTALN